MAVAVVERLKQELMYGLSAGTKKCGRCREVAVFGASTVFEFGGPIPVYKIDPIRV